MVSSIHVLFKYANKQWGNSVFIIEDKTELNIWWLFSLNHAETVSVLPSKYWCCVFRPAFGKQHPKTGQNTQHIGPRCPTIWFFKLHADVTQVLLFCISIFLKSTWILPGCKTVLTFYIDSELIPINLSDKYKVSLRIQLMPLGG